jgi:hypothetical protein
MLSYCQPIIFMSCKDCCCDWKRRTQRGSLRELKRVAHKGARRNTPALPVLPGEGGKPLPGEGGELHDP